MDLNQYPANELEILEQAISLAYTAAKKGEGADKCDFAVLKKWAERAREARKDAAFEEELRGTSTYHSLDYPAL